MTPAWKDANGADANEVTLPDGRVLSVARIDDCAPWWWSMSEYRMINGTLNRVFLADCADAAFSTRSEAIAAVERAAGVVDHTSTLYRASDLPAEVPVRDVGGAKVFDVPQVTCDLCGRLTDTNVPFCGEPCSPPLPLAASVASTSTDHPVWATVEALRDENAALRERVKALEGALRNCQAMAAREVRKSLPGPERDGWEHVLRFCREGGVESTVLRGDAATPDREEA